MSTVYRAILLLVLVSAMILFWWLVVPEDETPAEPGWLVTYVTDGDTFDVARGSVTETVRVIGIDTPERDECGYDEATEFLESIILDQTVTLIPGATTDRDPYDRVLRYVEYGGLDVGLGMISEGYAVARYDSRTNQPHPREDLYQEADAGTPDFCESA